MKYFLILSPGQTIRQYTGDESQSTTNHALDCSALNVEGDASATEAL